MYGLAKQVKSGDCPSEEEVAQLKRDGALVMQGTEKTQKAKIKVSPDIIPFYMILEGFESHLAPLSYTAQI